MAELDQFWFGQGRDAEMGALEDVSVPVLDDFFQLLYLPALVWTQRFQVDLLEYFAFHLLKFKTDGGAIDIRFLAFEGVTEIVYKFIGIEFLLF